jgi:hypothetical protein
MSNGADDTPRPSSTGGAPPPTRDALPTPPRSSNASADYSDAASVDSQNPSVPRRRHPRGGRKKRNKKGGRLQSVSEFEVPLSNNQSSQDADVQPTVEEDAHEEAYDAEELRKAKSSRSEKQRSPRATTTTADTGVRAFNLAKAQSSGGRPFGLTIERERSPGAKVKGKKAQGENRGTDKTGDREGGREEEDQGRDIETRKPVSIRLDLNLEVEIFLRAKIKGDVTITFL